MKSGFIQRLTVIGNLFVILNLIDLPAFGEIRLRSPKALIEHEGRDTQRDQISQSRFSLDLEIPIPVAAGPGMPYMRFFTSDSRRIDHSAHSLSDQQRLAAVGLLDHAAEGAPYWKAEVGRWGRVQGRGFLFGRLDLNLEKAFPALRPGSSDKLDSWFGVWGLAGSSRHERQHILAQYEVGWSWLSLSGLIAEIIVPRLLRIGFKDDEWTGSIVATQQEDLYECQRIESETVDIMCRDSKRRVMIEATKDVEFDLTVGFAAGLQRPRTPITAIQVGWKPRM